ncbi:MAG: HPF/RaiA family ribosome-associated protein [Colwellia sp.]|nr:HPF/RaiA family ribosome-associated protein [Colwellia sp.]MCW8865224.1 HPF/RaiA family ribosome-associated protein [Colwellia sp.]MCW9081302.1 HPF/RaiA family ribosome-associated protein [Colwellia sp.]
MKIDIQNRLIEIEQSIEELIQRKLRLALSKMDAYISSITFIISDAIGQNGNVEKHCSLTLSLYRMPNIVIEETHADLYFVIDRVIQKAARTLSRKLS